MSINCFSAIGAAVRFHGRLRVLLLVLLLLSSGAGGCAGKSTEPVLVPYDAEDPEAGESGAGKPGAGKEEESDQDPEGGTFRETEVSRETETFPETEASRESEASREMKTALETEAALETVTVHVCGAVKKEGVYTLAAGSRIMDAVDAAGGFSTDADTSYLNLAMQIGDGWQIYVPTKEEAESLRSGQVSAVPYGAVGAGGTGGRSGAGSAAGADASGGPGSTGNAGTPGIPAGTGSSGSGRPDRKVNINTASLEELMTIPGIGEAKARRILEYREENGRFEDIEDLMKVSGIKENSFRKMKEYITN